MRRKTCLIPLAFQLATPGHDPGAPLGIPGTPERETTALQVAIAPRIGISHPMSDNAVLHFVYGHFYQRPSWTKMFGFPFVNYTEAMDSVLNPYAKQTTFMDEWQGYYGNPEMGYERTIQYELGVDYNIADMLKLDVTGYYKDASREATVITGVYAATYTATKALMVSNSGYSDVRGIETKIDSRFNGMFNFGLSHEVYWSFNGEVGFSRCTNRVPRAWMCRRDCGRDGEHGATTSASKGGRVFRWTTAKVRNSLAVIR